MGGGEAGREEVWTMLSLLPRKQHKQSVKMRESPVEQMKEQCRDKP